MKVIWGSKDRMNLAIECWIDDVDIDIMNLAQRMDAGNTVSKSAFWWCAIFIFF